VSHSDRRVNIWQPTAIKMPSNFVKNSIKDLLGDEIKDLYSAEKQLTIGRRRMRARESACVASSRPGVMPRLFAARCVSCAP
jgi:hypothetical protein